MILLWLATGLTARQAEVEAEKRGKGGSGKGWLLRDEFAYRDEAAAIEAVTIEDVRQATAKLRPAPEPGTVMQPAPAPATEAAPAVPVAVLFERPPEIVSVEPPAPAAPVVLKPNVKAALGLKPIERTYDLELLLLVAA